MGKIHRIRHKAQKALYKDFAFDSASIIAFGDRRISKAFKKAYIKRMFRNEIRYFHVTAQVVSFEQKLLEQYQQKDIPALLAAVYNELDLNIKLIFGIDNDKYPPLAQLAESILQSLKVLHTIVDYLTNVKLVHKTMLPHQK